MKAWLIRILALIVFAVSFALPAIRPAGPDPASQTASQPGNAPQTIPGWTCAMIASTAAPKALAQSIGQGLNKEGVEVFLSGLINYLFVLILVLSAWRRLVRTRLVVGALMIPCLIATWMFFAAQKFTPLVGHYMWIGGAVLLLVPDVVAIFSGQATPSEKTAAYQD